MSNYGSLQGLRVVEISTSVAGPYFGAILGDLGAEVIKIEQVGRGEDTRKWAPPSWGTESVTFMSLNRNKKSLELDYKDPRGKEILEKLIASADIFVQNLRPGALAKAGFSLERLEELNPRLIYCEMSGFGRTGPKAKDAAYDPLLQAYSGIVSMMAPVDGSPVRVPLSILDRGTAMWGVIGVLDALRRREQTGKGTHVEVSLLQTAMAWTNVQIMGAMAGNEKRKALGSGHDGVVPYGAFPVSDGHIFMSAGNQVLWTRFLEATGHSDLNDRPGFGSNPERATNRDEVNRAVGEITSQYTSADLLAKLKAAGVPCENVNTVEDMVDDPQVAALGMLQAIDHPLIPDYRFVNLPMTFDGEYAQQTCPPPLLGADSAAVVAGLGYATDDIDALMTDGVIAHTQKLEN